MLELQDDYLVAEPELVTLLETIDGIKKVYGSENIEVVKERSQVTPATHVIYQGDRVPDKAQGGMLTHVTQTWAVVLVVNLKQKQSAGTLLASLVKALSGVHTALGPINRVNAGQKPLFRSGFGYYPIVFELTFRTKGART